MSGNQIEEGNISYMIKKLKKIMLLRLCAGLFGGYIAYYFGVDYSARYGSPNWSGVAMGILNIIITAYYLFDKFPRWVKLKKHLPIHNLLYNQNTK